ncbi:gamma-glutamyl-gamma-aminobutyrate hydrolase family protein, partial [Clostridium perfringens]
TTGGVFARLIGQERIRVNSLHGQGIRTLGARVVMEGIAEDGTITRPDRIGPAANRPSE